MALASLVQYGDRLAGGIDMVGISNFVTFLTNTSGYRRDLRRVEYGDERDPQMRALLSAISPLTNAASIRKPLLIVQGLNDPRVPASESEQMKAVVRANGGEVWYLAAKDEGHGFRKKANSDACRAVAVAFLKYRARRRNENAAQCAAFSRSAERSAPTSRRSSFSFIGRVFSAGCCFEKYSASALISSGFSWFAYCAISSAVGEFLRAPER